MAKPALVSFASALLAFWKTFEEVERIVNWCSQSGVELIRPRRLLVYRKRLEGFIEPATEQGVIRPGAVVELRDAIEAIEDPQLLIDDLQIAGVRGPAMRTLAGWARAYDNLVRAGNKAFDELES